VLHLAQLSELPLLSESSKWILSHRETIHYILSEPRVGRLGLLASPRFS
jgi:hypothetical protein